MAKYVKFLRGSPEAFAKLKHKDSDTLYFIYEEDEADKEEVEAKRKTVKTQKAEQEAINVLLTTQKQEKSAKVQNLSKEEKELQALLCIKRRGHAGVSRGNGRYYRYKRFR